MRFRALATDYDGTIAHDGRVDEETVESLRAARGAGLRLILVTGRELTDLFNTFAHATVFDRIVAENGAVLYNPGTKEIEVLGGRPPQDFVAHLTRQNIPLSVGHGIVATVEPHAHAVFAAIHDLSLDWHVIFNKGAVMALPSTVTKLSGLERGLADIGARAEETIGIGDAENDIVFLKACGLSVSVANALETVKDVSDLVTIDARGAGVREFIHAWLGGLEERRVPKNPASRSAG